jgi:hypothetical protein
MTDIEFDDIVTDDKQESTSSSTSSTPTYVEPDNDVGRFIVDVLDQKGRGIMFPAFDDDAKDVKEAYTEEYGIEGTLSVEDLFERDYEGVDFITSFPTIKSDRLDEEVLEEYPDEVKRKDGGSGDIKAVVPRPEVLDEYQEDYNLRRQGITEISKILNGYWAEEIEEKLGDDAYVSVSRGKKRNTEDQIERMKTMHFDISKTDKRAWDRKKAQNEVGELTDEELAEWAENNGFEDKL